MSGSTPEILCTPEDLAYALGKMWNLIRQGATAGAYVQNNTLYLPSEVASVTDEGKLVLYSNE